MLDAEEIKYANADEEKIKNCVVLVAMLTDLSSPSTSLIVKENAKLLARIAEVTNGLFLSGTTLESLLPLTNFRGMGSRPMNQKILLELSPSVRIPCIYWKKSSVARFPTLKKESECYDQMNAESGEVKRDTSYLVPSLDNQETLFQDRVKGYKYGESYIPIAGDEGIFEVKGEGGLKLIGFVPLKSIKRHHFLDAAFILQGSPLLASSPTALRSIHKALSLHDSVAICRFAKKENGDISQVALLPCASDEGSLVMLRLPCAEDIRDIAFKTLSNKVVSREQKRSISELVNAYSLLSKNGESVFLMHDAALQNLYLTLEQRAVGADSPLAKCARVLAVCDRSETEVPRAIQAVKEAFPLVAVDSKHVQVRKFWSDIAASSSRPSETTSVTSEGRMPTTEVYVILKFKFSFHIIFLLKGCGYVRGNA